MKVIGVILIMISGWGFLTAIGLVRQASVPGHFVDTTLPALVGGFAIPGLLLWWGIIAIRRPGKEQDGASVTRD